MDASAESDRLLVQPDSPDRVEATTMTPKAGTSKKAGLLTWKEIEPWQRDNEFILTGYRHASFSFSRSVQSILAVHNETANIWSHLIGAAQFLIGLLNFIRLRSFAGEAGSRSSDIVAVGVYYLCVVVCFVLSTIFHTFANHSAGVHRFGNELDHLGIVLVMWGTGVSGVHFAFHCQPRLQVLYHVALTGTAIGCGVFTMRPKFRQPTYRTMRFLMYCFLGSSLFAPVLHGWARFGLAALDDMMGLKSFLGLALINFSGAALYAARIPERWFPGTFDLLGQSHNLMHILVFTGALVRLNGLLEVIGRWQQDTLANGLCQSID